MKQVLRRMRSFMSDFHFSYWLWLVGYFPSMHVRLFIYRHIYHAKIGADAVIYKGLEIRSPKKLKIGKGSIIGDNAMLDARCGITIGENVNFSSGVEIWTLQHDYRDPDFKCTAEHCGPVVIDDRVWVGPRVTILHSVTIGEGAVVAAGSIVTKNVDPYTVVAGVPAKKVADRPRNLRYVFDGSHRHFI